MFADNQKAFSNFVALFDNKTQKVFYRNLINAMQTQDYMLPGITLNPELLVLIEQANAKKFKID